MKMNRSRNIIFIRPLPLVILFVVLCVFLSGCAKKAKKVYRVGIVSGAQPFDDIADGFKAGMTELGYIEGKNITYDFRELNADPGGVERAIEKFAADEVDLIFAFPTGPAMAAKAATKGTNIPVVFAMAGVEGNNLIESISRPGGNITGVRYPGPESTVTRFSFLLELVPSAKRVYLIYDPNYPNVHMALGGLRPAAVSMGVTLVKDPVRTVEELQAALKARDALDDVGVDAILIMPDIVDHSLSGFKAILEFANKHQVPIGGGMDFTADLGALFSFVPDNFEQGRMAAPLADKIFKGTPAGSIMVVTPPSRLRLNYKVIQDFGIDVSEGMLSRADEIIR